MTDPPLKLIFVYLTNYLYTIQFGFFSFAAFIITAVRLQIRLEISIETETSVASLIISLITNLPYA